MVGGGRSGVPAVAAAVRNTIGNIFGERQSKSFAKLSRSADGTYTLPQAKFNQAGEPTAAYKVHLSGGKVSDIPMNFVDTLDANGNPLQPIVKAYLDLPQQLRRSAYTEMRGDVAKWGAPVSKRCPRPSASACLPGASACLPGADQ